MKYKTRYAVLAALTIGVLITLAFTFTTPLLYTLGNDLSVSSRYHENVDVLKQQSLNSTMDVDPDLQGMLDFAGPISLTIEIHDYEDARRYLDLFGENQASVKNLIVRLDMEDSEIQELEKNTALQKRILESLLNTSVSLDALQSMELQYYSESTQEMRTPFRLRGNELRKKVRDLNQRYRNATQKVKSIGTKMGLDVAKNKESETHVQEIIRKIEEPATPEILPGETTPGSGTATPGSGITTPGPGPTTPGSGTATPGSGTTTPVPGTTTPGSVTATPGSGTTTPVPGPSSAGSGTVTTNSGTATPVPGPTTAGSITVTPNSGTTTPGPGPKTAGSGSVILGSGTTTSGSTGNRMSLAVKPETGKFRDTIEYSGVSLSPGGCTTPRSESNPVTVYIDEKPVTSAVTDRFGIYTARIPVEGLQPGNHTVYSRSPTSRSEDRTLSVTPADSVTYLMASDPDSEGNVVFEGVVETNAGPVVSAPVRITWDESNITTTTDEDGYFREKIPFSPGRHSVVANFSSEGYPINPSESTPQTVEISILRSLHMDSGQTWLVIAVIGICILILADMIFYRIRGRRRTSPAGTLGNADITPDQTGNTPQSSALDPGPVKNEDGESGDETLLAGYSRLLREQGLSAASRDVYMKIAGRMANDFTIRHYKSMTARELSLTCRGKPYCGAFSRFVAVYERIRYGRKDSLEDQAVFETALDSTDEQMGSGKQ